MDHISDALAPFIHNDSQRQWVKKALELAEVFATRAERYDRENRFPFENFEDLRQAGFHKLTIPKAYGGDHISLYEFVLIQETLAAGCASTALGLGWHLGLLLNLRETKAWPQDKYESICKEIVEHGKWMNSCSTEPSTGSPSRGRRHETTAVKTSDGWVINGHKTWSTLSPLLDIFLITAAIDGSDDMGEFYVPRGTPGLTVKETWDSIGMRATGSHDVLLENVVLPDDALLSRHTYGQPSPKSKDGGGWLLHVPACYLGIAAAARHFAVSFAKHYHPKGMEQPISGIPGVRDRLGEMETKLYGARAAMYQAAARWDAQQEERHTLRPIFGAAKLIATNQAVEIVDLAMRIVGGRSMLRKYPLERYYRDIRGGLHNPPMDDAVRQSMATFALNDVKD